MTTSPQTPSNTPRQVRFHGGNAEMENIRKVLSAMLVASGVVGVGILTMDRWLWFAEPAHAYGLAVFIGFGGILAAALWREGRTRLPVLGAILLPVVQFTAMIGDM